MHVIFFSCETLNLQSLIHHDDARLKSLDLFTLEERTVIGEDLQ